MSREKIKVGLTKIEFPEHRFDTLDGGIELYNTLKDFAKRVSDDAIGLRVFNLQLAPNEEITVSHNIPMPELVVRFFTSSGAELPKIVYESVVEVTQISMTELKVRNITNVNQIFLLVVVGLPQAFRNVQLENVAVQPPAKNNYCILYYHDGELKAKLPDNTVFSLSSLINVPVGAILRYQTTATQPPSGFLFCDGSAVSRTAYSRLFNVVGTIYGAGDGSSTFNLPNINDSIIKF